MRIADTCNRTVVHALATTSVRVAARLMRKHHVGALVVVQQPNGERLPLGVVTDRDIVISVIAAGADLDTLTVGDIMTQPVVSCVESQDVFDAIELMRAHGVRRLPVTNAKGGLCGIIAADDLFAVLGKHFTALSAALVREQVRELETRV